MALITLKFTSLTGEGLSWSSEVSPEAVAQLRTLPEHLPPLDDDGFVPGILKSLALLVDYHRKAHDALLPDVRDALHQEISWWAIWHKDDAAAHELRERCGWDDVTIEFRRKNPDALDVCVSWGRPPPTDGLPDGAHRTIH